MLKGILYISHAMSIWTTTDWNFWFYTNSPRLLLDAVLLNTSSALSTTWTRIHRPPQEQDQDLQTSSNNDPFFGQKKKRCIARCIYQGFWMDDQKSSAFSNAFAAFALKCSTQKWNTLSLMDRVHRARWSSNGPVVPHHCSEDHSGSNPIHASIFWANVWKVVGISLYYESSTQTRD